MKKSISFSCCDASRMCNRRQSGCGPKIAVGSWWDTLRAPNNPLVSLDFSCSFVREIHPQIIYQSINIINQLNSSSTSQRASKSHLPIGKEPVSIGLRYIHMYTYYEKKTCAYIISSCCFTLPPKSPVKQNTPKRHCSCRGTGETVSTPNSSQRCFL